MARISTRLRGGPKDGLEREWTSPVIDDEIVAPYKVPGTQMMGFARYVRTDRIVGLRGAVTFIYDYRGEYERGKRD